MAKMPEDYDREAIMKDWDSWRWYIKSGGGGTWPRDAFEAYLDYFEHYIESLPDAPEPAEHDRDRKK